MNLHFAIDLAHAETRTVSAMTNSSGAMKRTRLGDLDVSALGFGCMTLTHVYGGIADDEARQTLNAAVNAGISP